MIGSIDQMKDMMSMAMAQATDMARQKIKIAWHTRIFDNVSEIANFLNDGKNVTSVQMIVFEGKIMLLYATA